MSGRRSCAAVACTLAGLGAVAAADTSEGSSAELAEVVVTAQRRAQNVQEVPITIQVARGRDLADRQVTTNDELMSIVPDLRVSSAFGALVQDFTLRGIGPANNFNSNVEPPVGLYMDDIYQSFVAAPGTQLFDLARIEVLKGPQGTLYGRNTTGGAISYISNKPRLEAGENEGNVSVGVGDYDQFEAQGASDITLIDHLLGVRVALYHASRDGFVDNVGTEGPKSFGSENTTDGRVLVRFVPSSELEALLAIYVNSFEGSMTGNIGYGIFANDTLGFPGGYSRAGLSPYQAAFNYVPASNSQSTDVALTTTRTSGPLKLISISSFEHSDAFNANDCDSSPLDICASASRPTSSQAGQEFRADYTVGRLHLLGGASYDWDRYLTQIHDDFGGLDFFENSYEQSRNSTSAHVDGTYALNDRFDMTLGLRETYDDTRISHVRTLLLSSMDGTPVGMTIPVAGPFIPNLFLPAQSRADSGLSGRAIASYRPTDGLMTYLSYSRGYRAGAFNGVQLQSAQELNSVGPETDNQVEVGAKATINARVSLSAAVFNIGITNQQIVSQGNVAPCPTCNPPVAGSVFPALAGLNGRSRGAEFDLDAAVTAALRTTLAVTLLDTRYDDGPKQQVSGVSVAGKRFAFAPAAGVHAGAVWTAWHAGEHKVTLAADVAYTGRYWFDPTNGANEIGLGFIMRQGQQAYTLVDARLSYEVGRVRLLLWGANLFNQYYTANANNVEAAFGSTQTLSGQPRTFGAKAEVAF